MKTIRYYISGHGLGHASRACQVIRALKTDRPDLEIEVVSTAHRWFFDSYLEAGTPVRPLALDIGVLQQDSLRMQVEETLQACRRFEAELQQRIDAEARSLEQQEVDLVVADAPSAAFVAAHTAGIPSVLVANFTWDWVYRYFNQSYPGYEDVVQAEEQRYAMADLWLRLPFHPPESPVQRVEDVPMIARTAHRSGDEVRQQLGLPNDQHLALLCFGGFGLTELDLSPLADCTDWLFIGEYALPEAPANYRCIAPGTVYFPDLVGAADVVVTKPGYGIVSEAIANRTAVLYTPRGDFPEQPILQQALADYTCCVMIENEDFRRGEWREALGRTIEQAPAESSLAADGAEVVAERLLKALYVV